MGRPVKARKLTGEVAVVPKSVEVVGFTDLIAKEAAMSLKHCEGLAVEDDEDRALASKTLAIVAATLDEWDGKRKSWVQPLKAVASDIDANFRPALQALRKCEALLKERIGAFDVAQAQKRAALLKEAVAAGAAGNRQIAERIYEKADEHAAAEGGSGSKIEWTGEVVDADAIPREYCKPDLEKLLAVTKAADKDPGIMGWKAYQAAAVRTSRKAGG